MNAMHATRRWFDVLPVVLPLLLVLAVLGPGRPPAPPERPDRANGCLWDSDTLRTEANGLPGVAEIITGRFDRFPPEYYEARLTRVSARIDAGESVGTAGLADYDDAGVACDRLGRGDEAIAWMARKLAVIEGLESAEPSATQSEEITDARYKYLANLGTFHAHRWLRGGADREDMVDLERSYELIGAAIELNPDAHFGRERYQLMAIEWLLDPPDWDEDLPPTFFEARSVRIHGFQGYWYDAQALAPAGYADAVEGLTGLIALGNAWESVDIFLTLAAALDDRGDASLAHLARLRARERLAAGTDSLHPSGSMKPSALTGFEVSSTPETATIETWYDEARVEAEAWRGARNEYVLQKLAAGSHPDTDPGFWADWVSGSSPPEMPNGLLSMVGAEASGFLILVILAAITLGSIVPVVLVILAISRRRARLRRVPA